MVPIIKCIFNNGTESPQKLSFKNIMFSRIQKLNNDLRVNNHLKSFFKATQNFKCY